MQNRAKGDRYEKAAQQFLLSLGYQILSTNYRFGRKEIDIVCTEGRELIFVEVKGGSSEKFGDPVHRVDQRKRAAITDVAQAFIQKEGGDYNSYRFDVVLVRDVAGHLSIEHIRSAFTL